ncbi:hypothetical protein JZ785_12620 [Alicyclobacillus curvatus]|nr:hypothetical protein JZ785_12620 [Alicyclobacillus curvatus]
MTISIILSRLHRGAPVRDVPNSQLPSPDYNCSGSTAPVDRDAGSTVSEIMLGEMALLRQGCDIR